MTGLDHKTFALGCVRLAIGTLLQRVDQQSILERGEISNDRI